MTYTNSPLKSNTEYKIVLTMEADEAFSTSQLWFATTGSDWTNLGTTVNVRTEYATYEVNVTTGDNGSLTVFSFKLAQATPGVIQITLFDFVEVN